jgi:two-component system cell cycle sensor histidine kinase PleC
MLRGTFDARRIRVALHTPAPVRLSADPRHLRQILLNVLGNAAKFGREDGHVELRLWADAAGAHISIADDGPGIASADPAALFEPFARGEGTAGVEGSGLGLPIVKGLVEAHGGRVEIESAPARGTTIRLHFPASRVL